MEGSLAENDDEEGTLLIEAPHDLENNKSLENSAKRSRTKRICVGTKRAHSQGSTSGTPCNNVLKNPSSTQEIVNIHPVLCQLKAPSRSDGSNMKEISLMLMMASLKLISDINEAADANCMIDLASKAFAYWHSLKVDYTLVYEAVCSVIIRQCDKEALAEQKPHHAFETKAAHDNAASEFPKAEERRTGVNRKIKEAQHDTNEITVRLNRLYDEAKKLEEEKAEAEARVADARAAKVKCDEAYFKAKAELEKIAPAMGEAQKAIDVFETRWKETSDGLDRAMEDLLSLKPSLQ